jgi:hypothetical protein
LPVPGSRYTLTLTWLSKSLPLGVNSAGGNVRACQIACVVFL